MVLEKNGYIGGRRSLIKNDGYVGHPSRQGVVTNKTSDLIKARLSYSSQRSSVKSFKI